MTATAFWLAVHPPVSLVLLLQFWITTTQALRIAIHGVAALAAGIVTVYCASILYVSETGTVYIPVVPL